ncbi:MAG: biopolymer transporter ExbD [Burkholderiales bacterium]|nr:biopolymer transporter ExbD [Burkholderiales bacterium]OJX04431.1 MAG: biopolymer transporter ExbD [Burkholderiales bacterium 70-64]
MAFGGLEPTSNPQPMAEINTTPLVDVMLVLLVIFIITAPLLTHAIRLDLPSAQAPVAAEKPDTISLSIDRSGALFWNEEALDGLDALDARLAQAAARQPQPELHLRADADTRYERIAAVMASAQQAGIAKIGFVTDPHRRSREQPRQEPARR